MEFYSRKSPRLPNFDYSSHNHYFVTLCAHNKACIFGDISHLNVLGNIAKLDLRELSFHYKHIHVDNFIVMPNHVHAIIIIDHAREETKQPSLATVIGLYKSGVSRKIRQIRPELTVWQRSFHDHIIRNQQEYEKIWQYIQFNYTKWKEDCFYVGTDEDKNL